MARKAKGVDGACGVAEARRHPRQSRSHRLVEQIVDAATRLLSDEGAAAITTNAVADRADVSVGSLYRYFANKEALILAVMEREGRRFHDLIVAGVTADHEDAPVPIDLAVGVLIDAYRLITSHDPLLTVEMQAEGIFDRKAAALKGVTDFFRSSTMLRDEDGRTEKWNAAPVMAEIIVGLIEASIRRPTTMLSTATIEQTAIAAATGYLRQIEQRSSGVSRQLKNPAAAN